jgi:hypothetical protein
VDSPSEGFGKRSGRAAEEMSFISTVPVRLISSIKILEGTGMVSLVNRNLNLTSSWLLYAARLMISFLQSAIPEGMNSSVFETVVHSAVPDLLYNEVQEIGRNH